MKIFNHNNKYVNTCVFVRENKFSKAFEELKHLIINPENMNFTPKIIEIHSQLNPI